MSGLHHLATQYISPRACFSRGVCLRQSTIQHPSRAAAGRVPCMQAAGSLAERGEGGLQQHDAAGSTSSVPGACMGTLHGGAWRTRYGSDPASRRVGGVASTSVAMQTCGDAPEPPVASTSGVGATNGDQGTASQAGLFSAAMLLPSQQKPGAKSPRFGVGCHEKPTEGPLLCVFSGGTAFNAVAGATKTCRHAP